jgi:4-hydroxythreonine-4-phosphate dehydrogenase
MGDPAGIGPEVILKAAAYWAGKRSAPRLLVIGDLAAMKAAARTLGSPLPRPVGWNTGQKIEPGADTLSVLESSKLTARSLDPGRPTIEGAKAAYLYIETGARMALDGRAAALVTAPISKEWLNRAGYQFPGHSELLAEIAKVPRWRMMFAGGRLKLALVTVHIGLAKVSRALSTRKILDTIDLLAAHMRTDAGMANSAAGGAGI